MTQALPYPLTYLHEAIYPRRSNAQVVEDSVQVLKDIVYGELRGDLLLRHCYPHMVNYLNNECLSLKGAQNIDGNLGHSGSFLAALIIWDAGGRNSFMFSEGLAERLAETHIEGVPSYAVRLPYDCVWLELPGSYQGENSPGCFVMRHVETERWGRWSDGRSMWREGEIGDEGREYLLIVFRLRRTGEDGREEVKNDLLPIPLLKGKMIEECIDRGARWKISALIENGDIDGKGVENAGESMRAAWGGMVEAAINALLYLSCPKADLQPVATEPSRKLRSDRERTQRRRGRHRTAQVGLRFTTARQKTETVKGKESSGSGRHNRLHRVRGHWKMVPFGPGKKQRRATWIEPFWRGRGVVEETPRTSYVSK